MTFVAAMVDAREDRMATDRRIGTVNFAAMGEHAKADSEAADEA